MLYCEKCRRLCEDSAARCPACRSQKLRPAGEEDLAFLCRCDLYAGEKIGEALAQAGIPHSVEDAEKGSSYYTFDSESMPTDKRVYAQVARMEEAKDLAAQVSAQAEQERSAQTEEEAPPPTAKRLVGEVLSVVAFLVLIMLAVYGADGLAGWLKGLFGIPG